MEWWRDDAKRNREEGDQWQKVEVLHAPSRENYGTIHEFLNEGEAPAYKLQYQHVPKPNKDHNSA